MIRALRIEQHGPVADLVVSEVAPPRPGAGEVLVRIEAAGLNPSDLASVLGRFPGAPLPRVLGRDFAGQVIEGPPGLVGTAVWGSGGDLGILRDGTHAELVALPATAVAPRPARLTAEEAATAGVPFVTAFSALETASVVAGEWVAVSGAAGAVGTAAARLIRARGARALALVRDAREAGRLDPGDFEAVATLDDPDPAGRLRELTSGRGCAVALDGVGGPVLERLVEALADGGRLVVYSAAAGRELRLDVLGFYRRSLSLFGLNTVLLDASRGARILHQLAPLFEAGTLRPLRAAARYPLLEAPAAYARQAQGGGGKLVLFTAS